MSETDPKQEADIALCDELAKRLENAKMAFRHGLRATGMATLLAIADHITLHDKGQRHRAQPPKTGVA